MEIIKYPSIQNRGTKCSFVFCPLWSGVGLVSIETQVCMLALYSGLLKLGEKAWYTLFAHGTHCLCMCVIKMEIYHVMTKLMHTRWAG